MFYLVLLALRLVQDLVTNYVLVLNMKTENPEQEIDRLIQVLVEGLGEGPGFGYYPDDARPSALLEQAGSPLAPSMARTEAQLATREKDLAVETEKGREQFIADAKKRILALRQTNTPDGMQLAAAFEQRVVEQEITDTMEAANTKLINAAERLFGNKESAAQDVDLGLRFYDLQLKLVTALKAKRDKLYNAVPDFDVKSLQHRTALL